MNREAVRYQIEKVRMYISGQNKNAWRRKMRSVIEMPKKKSLFGRDERGNVGIIFGVALLPVIFFAGAATDYGRALKARTVLQAAADAAVVAAANSNGDADTKRRMAADIFAANATTNGTQGVQPTLTAVVDADNNPTGQFTFTTPTVFGTATTTINVATTGITVTPVLNVPTTFMRLAGINDIPVSGASLATGSSKKLEIAMMVDLTGSMSWNDKGSPAAPKINGLKTASVDFLNILFPNGATFSNSTRVAVVPFADYVNAGDYANDVTGLSASAGSGTYYAKLTNLANTRQGAFSGTYAGTFSGMTQTQLQASGGQVGATPTTGVPSGATPTPGNTFVSTHTATCNGGIMGYLHSDSTAKPFGPKIPNASSSGTPPSPAVSGSTGYYRAQYYDDVLAGGNQIRWQDDGDHEPDYYTGSTAGHYMPTPNDISQVTFKEYSSGVPYGIEITLESLATTETSAGYPNQISVTGSGAGKFAKYRKITGYAAPNTSGADANGWKTTEVGTAGKAFMRIPTSLPSTTVSANCTNQVDQANGQLITCVTERKGTNAYTAVAPSGSLNQPNTSNWIGSYNQGGNATKQNYSSDGKCWVAGRELPKVIPLTNTKATLTNFFTNATVGGATPGHIGTAWAWYMVAPEWNTIFPSASAAQPYDDQQTIKAVILMTDGEYNVHYATPSASAQALALCTAMKEKGIRVYTIGFGFGVTAAQDSTAESNARTMLTSCAGYKQADGTIVNTNAYFFPYDGTKLREHLVSIGNQLNTMAMNDIKVSQ
jgi:Flp pilus assembly protein TadG